MIKCFVCGEPISGKIKAAKKPNGDPGVHHEKCDPRIVKASCLDPVLNPSPSLKRVDKSDKSIGESVIGEI